MKYDEARQQGREILRRISQDDLYGVLEEILHTSPTVALAALKKFQPAPIKLTHAESCRGCETIGGCYKCGAEPFCLVINKDAFCTRCGADQGTEGDFPMEVIVRRDLRAMRGLHSVEL